MGRAAKWKSAGQGDLNRLAKLLGESEQGLEFKHDDQHDDAEVKAYLQFKAGNESALLDYWGGDGDIGSTGGFDRCVTALSGKDDIDDPEALCAWVHHEVTGEWPGKKGEDVSDMEMKREVVVPEGMTGLGYKVLDEDLGIVETIVSVTGIVDRVNDNILPGAYEKTLVARKPKGVWSHDWEQPISKTRKIEELKPGDPRLPTETKSGDPWPSGAGAVLVTAQFNLNTTLGRDAFESVKFFGDEQEWSIGYKVPVGKSRVDRKSGVREIQEMDLFEYSPVLFGAMPLATSLSSKSSDPHGGLAEPAMVAATVVSSLLGHIDAAHGSHDLFARALGELTVIGNGGWSSDAQVSCRAAAAAASAVANASSGKMQRDALQAASAFRMIADALEAADVEDLSMSGKAEDTESKDIASPAASVAGQSPAPHASMVPNRPMGVTGTQATPAARVMDQGQAPSTGSVPLGANDAGSQAPAPNGDLGRANTGGATNGQAPAPDGHDGAPASNGQWQVAHQYVDDGQGRCVRCGRSLGFDLHTGWSPGSMNRQQAADTLATEAGNTAQGSGMVDSGAARTVPTATGVSTMITGNKRYDVHGWEAKIDVPMVGSYEEMQRQLRDQANVVLRALDRTEDQDDSDESAEGVMSDYVCLEATFPDHIIASYTDYDDSPMTRYFTIPWMRDTDGSPKLGTPAEVDVAAVLTAKIDPHEVAEIITEVKAGRVLSAANMEKLRAAHGHLGTVLDSANAKKPDDGDGNDDEGAGDDDTKKKADENNIDAQLMEFEALRAGLLVSD